jgi:hypothetical protein
MEVVRIRVEPVWEWSDLTFLRVVSRKGDEVDEGGSSSF